MRAAVLWIQRTFPGDRILRSVAMLAGGNALAQLIVVLAAPVLTRLYMPADFGAAGVFAAFLGLLLAVASGRYELAISLPKDEESALDLLFLSLGLVVGTVAMCSAVVWFFGARIVIWTETPALGPYLWLLPFSLLGAGTYQALSYLAVRRAAYKRLARTKMSQGLGNVGASLMIGITYPGPLGLIMGTMLGQAVGVSSLLGEVRAHEAARLPRFDLRRILRLAVTYRRFPLYSAVASLLNTSGMFLPTVLLAVLYGTEVAGLFVLAQRLVTLPLAPVSQAVSMVFLSEASENLRSKPEALPGLFSRVTRQLALLSVLILAGGMLAPLVCGWIFGTRWQLVGDYFRILSIFAAANLITSPISTITTVLERQDIQLILDIARLVLVVLSLYLPYWSGGSGITAVTCFSVAMALIYFVTFLTCRRLIDRKDHASLSLTGTFS